jgi:ribosomal protein S18 acetylase RimI-like enzyme
VAGVVHGRFHYVLAPAADLALERDIIAWAETRVAAGATGSAGAILVHPVGPRDPTRADRLVAFGFHVHRVRMRMVRATTPALEAPMPAGYTLRPCHGPVEAPAYLDAFNTSFHDTHDFTPYSLDDLLHDLHDPGYRAERDLVLEDAGGAIVGFCYVSTDPATPDHAHIGAIGVLRAHRRQGLAAAVLADALRRLGADGVASVDLNVDCDSPTGAPRLYERAGFTVAHIETRYARPVGALSGS